MKTVFNLLLAAILLLMLLWGALIFDVGQLRQTLSTVTDGLELQLSGERPDATSGP